MHFNNSKNKFLILAYGSHKSITITQKLDNQGISMISVKKKIYSNTISDILTIHKSYSLPLPHHCNVIFSPYRVYR